MNGSDDACAQLMLTLSAAPALEESLIDWLLEQDEAGFSSQPAYGHSARHGHLSAAEQVSGRQRRIEFQTMCAQHRLSDLLADLQKRFDGCDIHYWVAPVIVQGHLAGAGGDGGA